MSGILQQELKRYEVYRAPGRPYLCIAAARDAKHALKIARQMFKMPRTSFAVLERRGS